MLAPAAARTFPTMPLPKDQSSFSSPAVNDLGLGDMLGQQVAGETEEMRKKRIAQMQERSMMGTTGSLATMALFGGGAGGYRG